MTYYRRMTFLDWLQLNVFNLLPVVLAGAAFALAPAGVAGAIALPLLFVSAWLVLWWQLANFGYQCRACGRAFTAQRSRFFAWHFGYSLRLTCPDCGQTTWTGLVRKVAEPDPKRAVPEAQDLLKKVRGQLRQGSGAMVERDPNRRP